MRFNTSIKKSSKIKNYEGADAFALDPKLALYTLVVTSALNNKFYEKTSDQIQRLRDLIAKNDPHFVAKLAVYSREKMYLRSIPLVLTVELAKIHNGDDLLSRLVNRVIQRADEITELLAYYQLANERISIKKLNKLSKQLQRGLALAFNKFDAYQFAKYNRQTEVKLKDALFLVHPKAKDENQQQIFNQIVNDSLEIPYTWEVELSALGQQKFDSANEQKTAIKAKWEELISSGKLGYMALLRNLRNILQADVDRKFLNVVVQRLGNAREVARSKQLPFRFLSAFRELQTVKSTATSLILNALEKAIQASAHNLQGFDEKTRILIACDTSGSMCTPISPRSTVQYYDIGLVLGMLLQSRSKSVMTGIFGDTWKVINLPQAQILSNVDKLRNRMGEVGYSTNGYLVIRDLVRRKVVMDKVMIFTDMQLWDSRGNQNSLASEWQEYRQIAPKAKLYIFDLAGYGQAPLNLKGDHVYLIAGWSEKIFEVLDAIEKGKSALTQIEEIIL
ncbi:MAG: TROVE domain-containing protein [Microscillaceae bacterium]|nr:TROVE domain-containing protein [Microscillaceae bacterium]